MLHEFKQIIEAAYANYHAGIANVMATVVHLEGSSYRKPGVRMLIDANGNKVGAVSGGCVENEIIKRAASVFETEQSKVITYDGRYRLGCEGVLYILIEPIVIDDAIFKIITCQLNERVPITLESTFNFIDDAVGGFFTVIKQDKGAPLRFSSKQQFIADKPQKFTQRLEPLFQLYIIGAEHDAQSLCETASNLGWQVTIVAGLKDARSIDDFPKAQHVLHHSPTTFDATLIPKEAAVVLMTHNYAQDLNYLMKLSSTSYFYLGVIGSEKRRFNLENDLLNYTDEHHLTKVETMSSPAGLDIGAITPAEIALSVCAEILNHRKTKTTVKPAGTVTHQWKI